MRISESKLSRIIREELATFLLVEAESSWPDYEQDVNHIVDDGRYLSALGQFKITSAYRNKPEKSLIGGAKIDARRKLKNHSKLRGTDFDYEVVDQRVGEDVAEIILKVDTQAESPEVDSPEALDTGDTGDSGERPDTGEAPDTGEEYAYRATVGDGVILITIDDAGYEVSLSYCRTCSRRKRSGNLVISREGDDRKYTYALFLAVDWQKDPTIGFDLIELRESEGGQPALYLHSPFGSGGQEGVANIEKLRELTVSLGDEEIRTKFGDRKVKFVLQR